MGEMNNYDIYTHFVHFLEFSDVDRDLVKLNKVGQFQKNELWIRVKAYLEDKEKPT